MYHDTLMSARIPEETGKWVTAQHEGRLLLFYPFEVREGIKTTMGVSDAAFCTRVVDLDTTEVFEGALIFGAALVPNLKGGIPDAAVCGRLTKSEKGAWVLMPHSQEELYVAQKWIQENLT